MHWDRSSHNPPVVGSSPTRPTGSDLGGYANYPALWPCAGLVSGPDGREMQFWVAQDYRMQSVPGLASDERKLS